MDAKVPDVDPPFTLTMADGSQTVLPQYILFALTVGQIVSLIRACLTGSCPSYDPLLSLNWVAHLSILMICPKLACLSFPVLGSSPTSNHIDKHEG